MDTQSFAQAIRQARNQDPDILAVGGIPDRETADALVQEAASGRLVIALVDGANCANAVEQYTGHLYRRCQGPGATGPRGQTGGVSYLVNRADSHSRRGCRPSRDN